MLSYIQKFTCKFHNQTTLIFGAVIAKFRKRFQSPLLIIKPATSQVRLQFFFFFFEISVVYHVLIVCLLNLTRLDLQMFIFAESTTYWQHNNIVSVFVLFTFLRSQLSICKLMKMKQKIIALESVFVVGLHQKIIDTVHL